MNLVHLGVAFCVKVAVPVRGRRHRSKVVKWGTERQQPFSPPCSAGFALSGAEAEHPDDPDLKRVVLGGRLTEPGLPGLTAPWRRSSGIILTTVRLYGGVPSAEARLA